MLKINKILSKKIKSPLSLRGLFPFCHSRESGNPSSLSLRGAKRRSNLSGFSLIELMVAAAILAMAIFGIFHAYSVGFMGMADARDRTVATNYVRETLENIKNMDFLEIENTNFITEEINIKGKIFTKAVHIDKIDDNLKKVTSWVSWYNRNNKYLEVKNTMLIQNVAITSDTGTAVKIVLYADPYYNVLPASGTTNLTAVLKDQKGNILTKWDNIEVVTFSIIANDPSDKILGSISPTIVTLNQGCASTVFTSSIEYIMGYVTIQALVVLPDEGQLTDTVTLRITDAGVAINLVANPQTILTNGSTSNIIATIVDAATPPNKVELAGNLITFSISDPSLGSLEGPNPVNADNGDASITLRSTELPGTVTITASATDLQTGTVEVTTSEEEIVPTFISISADPGFIYFIYNDEFSTITVTIKDQYGNPVVFDRAVSLSLSSDNLGYVVDDSLIFTGESFKTTVFHASSSGTVTITASCVGLVDDFVVIDIYNYPTDIMLTASPESIKADGSSYSQIKATLVDSEGIKVSIADNLITFTIDSEVSGFLEGTNPVKAVNGEANIILKSTELPGTVIITASAIGVNSGTVNVNIIGAPKYIDISVNPTTVALPNETAIVTVSVLDINENLVEFTGEIGLEITGTGSGTLGSSPDNPINSINFNNQSSVSTNFYPTGAGTVRIEAEKMSGEGDISGYFYSPYITIVTGVFVLYKDININYLEKYDYNGNYKDNWDPANIIYGKFCVDKSNNLYIINENNIFKKDSNGLLLSSNPTDFPAQHINIGGDGNIYYTQDSNPGSHAYQLTKIDPITLDVLGTINLTTEKIYYGLAVDFDGSIFIHNYTDQAIEKWIFEPTPGLVEPTLTLSNNYNLSELTIAGDYIGGIEKNGNAFKLLKTLAETETQFTLTGIPNLKYISSIGGDFLFSGLNDSNHIVFGRYGTDGSIKWDPPKIIDDIGYSDCIIGAHPF